MNLIELKCKNCGGVMKVNSDLNEIMCNYCGSKILIDDKALELDRIEKIKLDARIKNHEQELKEIEDKYNLNLKLKEKKTKSKICKFSIFFAGIDLLFGIVAFQDAHILSGITSVVQIILFILSALLSSEIIKPIFKKDYVIPYIIGIILSIMFIFGYSN